MMTAENELHRERQQMNAKCTWTLTAGCDAKSYRECLTNDEEMHETLGAVEVGT